MLDSYKIKAGENLHILLWLLKDTCWMLEWKIPGVLMIAPTMLVAILIAFYTRRGTEFWINVAIVFWISANASWMMMEFYDAEKYKLLTLIPFSLGLLCTVVFYLEKRKRKEA